MISKPFKPPFNEIKKACPDINENIIREHLDRLGKQYFQSFQIEQISEHIKRVSKLTPENPVEVQYNAHDNGNIECTIVAYDYPGIFSLITGILGGLGFLVESGKIFTYRRQREKPESKSFKLRKQGRPISKDILKRRIIIDHFYGNIKDAPPLYVWIMELLTMLKEIFTLMEIGDSESTNSAKMIVNELVVDMLQDLPVKMHSILFPVKIVIDNENEDITEMRVFSEDTPFFLYTLSTALNLQNIIIDHVSISTVEDQIIDEFFIVDSLGNKIINVDKLNIIKLSVLLTKQFTYFLGTAPDPYTALSRFEYLTNEILSIPEQDKLIKLLSSPGMMKDLARLLGTSDFIWEDFLRLQYETILPMLETDLADKGFTEPVDTIPDRLASALENAKGLDEQRVILNEFKDREIFLLDLDHILNQKTNLRKLAERLTILAEHIVNKAVELSYKCLTERYGIPRTVAGLETKYSLLGLGKFGGAALGYASDIELLFIYSDSGKTDGAESINNFEFYNLLVKEVLDFIKAKKEGIFSLDLRLRPYGNDGPLACSLDSFCRYYFPDGDAHSYERLALVRMRAIGGNKEFGSQLERLRDEIIYAAKSIDIDEIHELRAKQYKEKSEPGRVNAKFSPGALVDLEYTVQILQIKYGKENPSLRHPRIHIALDSLTDIGVLDEKDREHLINAYDFLRNLINGLRMLRGSAKDLFLPSLESNEFSHLARRTRYVKQGNLSPSKQLYIDFNTHTAIVRTFIERNFGRDSLPEPGTGNIADLILSDDIPIELARKILSDYGFKNPERAYVNFRHLSDKGEQRNFFASLAILACDILMRKSDPDMALNNWERFIKCIKEPLEHYQIMLSQPMQLDILMDIFSTSQYLSDSLIQNPDFLEWVVTPKNLYKSLKRKEIETELNDLYRNSGDHRNWLNRIRLLKKREILRIGTRDISIRVPLNDIVHDLSTLAEAFIEITTEKNMHLLIEELFLTNNADNIKNRFCILAFGKLGGNELNYSSDIDLMLVHDFNSEDVNDIQLLSKMIERVFSDLSSHTEEGYAYRVDLRLRPYGKSGSLIYSIQNLINYYKNNASLWEIQALLKVRAIAGNTDLGNRFLKNIAKIYEREINAKELTASIDRMRNAAGKAKKGHFSAGIDVKNGAGGIRDIEFLAQGIQLINIQTHPELLNGNTLQALLLLGNNRLPPKKITEQLSIDYIFLRKLEHFLQLYEDRQVHSIPSEPAQIEALSKKMLGPDSSAEQFLKQLEDCLDRTHKTYMEYLITSFSE